MAPVGANGFDWQFGMDARTISANDLKKDGGVRIYHVDARLLKNIYGVSARYEPVSPYDELPAIVSDSGYGSLFDLMHAYSNSNGYAPYLADDSRFHHLIELIPSDGTSKYRLSTPTEWSTFTMFSPKDLYCSGETFSVQSHSAAFPDAPHMNNGGMINYSVTVEHYDPATHEAIVTIIKTQ